MQLTTNVTSKIFYVDAADFTFMISVIQFFYPDIFTIAHLDYSNYTK